MPARVAISVAVLCLALCPDAQAQEQFIAAVRELADLGSGGADGADVMRRRSGILARMQSALVEWDRRIARLETRSAAALRSAAGGERFQRGVELGLAYRVRGRLEDALREFDAAAEAQPGASDIHVLRALTLETAGDDAAAGQAFRTAWERDPQNPVKAYLALMRDATLEPAARGRARTVLRQAFNGIVAGAAGARGAPFLVLDAIPDNFSRTPLVGDHTLSAVWMDLAEGRFDDALSSLAAPRSNALDGNDDSPRASFQRGRAAETQGRYADARRAYASALEGTLAGRHVLWAGIGRLAQVEGELDAAIDAFTRAVRLNPNDPVIRRELAGALAAAGRSDDGFAELAAALLIDPADAQALSAAGQLLLETDQAGEAVAVLRRALVLQPERLDTHYALALALAGAGRKAEAAQQFEQFERLSRSALENRRREVTGHPAAERAR